MSRANLSTAVAAIWFIESYELLRFDPFLSDLFAMSIANEHYSFRFNVESSRGFVCRITPCLFGDDADINKDIMKYH